MAKKAKTVKELDNQLKELVKVVEQLQIELTQPKLKMNSRIEILEIALKSRDKKTPVTTQYQTPNKN